MRLTQSEKVSLIGGQLAHALSKFEEDIRRAHTDGGLVKDTTFDLLSHNLSRIIDLIQETAANR